MSNEKKPQPTLGDGLLPLTAETVLIPSRPNRLLIELIPANVSFSDLHAVRVTSPYLLNLSSLCSGRFESSQLTHGFFWFLALRSA
jgi:hypothetical protein